MYRRIRYADPRWKTNKHQVIFEQKGLFQADVSIHHALCQTALQSYHSFTQRLQQGSLTTQPDDSDSEAQLDQPEASGNKWGFEHMPKRISAAQQAYRDGMADQADGPTVRLPNLQVQCPYHADLVQHKYLA